MYPRNQVEMEAIHIPMSLHISGLGKAIAAVAFPQKNTVPFSIGGH